MTVKVGDKVKAPAFGTATDEKFDYVDSMRSLYSEGLVGVVTCVNEKTKCVKIDFKDRSSWNYHIDDVEVYKEHKAKPKLTAKQIQVPAYAVVNVRNGKWLGQTPDRETARQFLQESKAEHITNGGKFQDLKLVKLAPAKFIR